MLGYDLRLKAAITISMNVDVQFAKFAFEGFLAFAVVDVAPSICDKLIIVVKQMLRHLGFKRSLNQSLGQLVEKPVFSNTQNPSHVLPKDIQFFCRLW